MRIEVLDGSRQFKLLTIHYALYQLAVAMAGGFVGAYLLKLGFSFPAALICYAGLLLARFCVRFGALEFVRAFGARAAVMVGAGVAAMQFIPLIFADRPGWLLVWLSMVAIGEALYWPVYHASVAVIGEGGARGRELGLRTAVGAIVGVVGPLLGGSLLAHFGAFTDFGLAAAFGAASTIPLALTGKIPLGDIPSRRESLFAMDLSGAAVFAADGWMSAGLAIAWPMALFVSLGFRFEAFGVVNAAAGLVGAVAGMACGGSIDRGGRNRYLVLTALALTAGFVLRASSGRWPIAAVIANGVGAAVMCLYVPLLMSVVYERAKHSGAAYRFHFGAEAGWDLGAAAGCLVGALAAWITRAPSLATLPGILGVWVVYRCVRSENARHSAVTGDAAPVASGG